MTDRLSLFADVTKALVADHLTIIIIEVLLPNVDIEKFTNNYQAVTSMWLVPLINAYIAILIVISATYYNQRASCIHDKKSLTFFIY